MPIIRSLRAHEHAFVTTQELADYLGVSRRHIEREIAKGALPARRYGRALRILVTDAQRYVGSTGETPR